MKVKNIMTIRQQFLLLDIDSSLLAACKIFHDNHISSILVTQIVQDPYGVEQVKFRGILTKSDLLDAFLDYENINNAIRRYVVTPYKYADESDDLATVAEKMIHGAVHHVIITKKEGEYRIITGIVSTMDFLTEFGKRSNDSLRTLKQSFIDLEENIESGLEKAVDFLADSLPDYPPIFYYPPY